MTLVLFLIVLATVGTLVALPLLRPGEEPLPIAAPGPDAGPGAEVDRVLSALSEIQYDYEMNKLSQRDYEELHTRYSRQAIGLVQAMEQAAPDGAAPELTAEEEAEAEIAALLEGAFTGVKRS